MEMLPWSYILAQRAQSNLSRGLFGRLASVFVMSLILAVHLLSSFTYFLFVYKAVFLHV